MNIEKQCAKMDVLRHDLNRLLSVTYNCAVRLAEHPDYEGRLNSFLCTFTSTLRTASQSLAAQSQELINLVDEELDPAVAWEPAAHAEALLEAPSSDPVHFRSGELLHMPPHDQEAQSV